MWPRLKRLIERPANAAGYTDANLVDVIVQKTKNTRDQSRIDDVLPGETILPTITGIAAARSSKPLKVVDFGGAAGLHYLIAKQAFPAQTFQWAIVETPEMTAAAASLENDELKFFTTLEKATAWLGQTDLMHCVSALQYVPDPVATLRELLDLAAPTMLWAKLMLGTHVEKFIQTSRLQDNGPGPLPEGIADRKITYTATRMSRASFIEMHRNKNYRLSWKAKETDSFLFQSAAETA